uniref:Serine-threonine/tyrosine-protein kinase catalytic domain-containing protein n=1 Tax=Zea mays TaxID=4577 RepID=A0A804RKJ1_MAIZE
MAGRSDAAFPNFEILIACFWRGGNFAVRGQLSGEAVASEPGEAAGLLRGGQGAPARVRVHAQRQPGESSLQKGRLLRTNLLEPSAAHRHWRGAWPGLPPLVRKAGHLPRLQGLEHPPRHELQRQAVRLRSRQEWPDRRRQPRHHPCDGHVRLRCAGVRRHRYSTSTPYIVQYSILHIQYVHTHFPPDFFIRARFACVSSGHLYVKSDVYGFGVVLLEMLTGLRALDTARPAQQHNLVEWAKPYLADRRKLPRLVDPRLEGQYPSKAALQAAQLTLRCLEGDPRSRPSMAEVVLAIEAMEQLRVRPRDEAAPSGHAHGHGRSSRPRTGPGRAGSSSHHRQSPSAR